MSSSVVLRAMIAKLAGMLPKAAPKGATRTAAGATA